MGTGRTDVRTFGRLFVRLIGRSDGRTDILPSVLWYIVPFESAAQKRWVENVPFACTVSYVICPVSEMSFNRDESGKYAQLEN